MNCLTTFKRYTVELLDACEDWFNWHIQRNDPHQRREWDKYYNFYQVANDLLTAYKDVAEAATPAEFAAAIIWLSHQNHCNGSIIDHINPDYQEAFAYILDCIQQNGLDSVYPDWELEIKNFDWVYEPCDKLLAMMAQELPEYDNDNEAEIDLLFECGKLRLEFYPTLYNKELNQGLTIFDRDELQHQTELITNKYTCYCGNIAYLTGELCPHCQEKYQPVLANLVGF
jgi:hypothetical protein